jgi:hypothetical protein
MEEDLQCRICLEKIEGKYIMPCNCSSGIFHKECLEKWILTKESKNCEVCLTEYRGIYLKYILHSYYLFNSIITYFAVLSLFFIMVDLDNLIKLSENNISSFIDILLVIIISVMLSTSIYLYCIYKYRLIWVRRFCYSSLIIFKA